MKNFYFFTSIVLTLIFCLVVLTNVRINSRLISLFILISPILASMFGIEAWWMSRERGKGECKEYVLIAFGLSFPMFLLCPIFLLIFLAPYWALTALNGFRERR